MFIQLTDDDTGQLFDVQARMVGVIKQLSATKTAVWVSGCPAQEGEGAFFVVRETRHKIRQMVRDMFEGGR